MFRGGFLLFWLVFGIGSLVVVIMSAVDASRHPEWAWQRTGQNKTLWLVLPIVLLVVCGIVGGIMGLVYLLSIKPKLVAAEQQGPPPTWGAGPGGYAPPGGQPGWGAPPPPPPSWEQPPPPPDQPWGQAPPPRGS
jgi:hypothetical protein